ncbi:MAG: NAD(P)-binding protein [Gammaproteobacteria bacterium]
MKIAIIGTGIAGNVAAWHLCREHDVSVFEANDYVGGHTHTHTIPWQDEQYTVDTGFIVFNYKTYPHFTQLLRELDVAVQPSAMSFSVKCEKTGLEYNGTSLNSLFAQRRNLLRPRFYRMLRDILRFNREAPGLLDQPDSALSLGEFLYRGGYSEQFIEHYLVPMGAAIWSADPLQMYRIPAQFFIRFFHNHGMLSVDERPQWYVIQGGSQSYVKKLTAPFAHRIRTRTPIESASPEEQRILGAIPSQANEAVLHTDSSVLPQRQLAWAAWNYHILPRQQDRVALSYNMNILQSIRAPVQFCVTLNNTRAIDPTKILKRLTYHHPVFSPAAVAAQAGQRRINGVNRTYYCGAYWRFGFHEDGVVSALDALQHFKEQQHAQLSLRRAS